MHRAVVPVATMLAIQVMISLSVLSLGVMMPAVARDLAIDPKLVGIFTAIIYAVAAVLALFAAGPIVRLGAVRICQMALLMAAIGLAFNALALVAATVIAVKMPISFGSIARSRATAGIITPSDSTESEIITWMASMVATGTTARCRVRSSPDDGSNCQASAMLSRDYIPYKSALFSTVLRRMRIEATSTMTPSTLMAPSPWAAASA